MKRIASWMLLTLVVCAAALTGQVAVESRPLNLTQTLLVYSGRADRNEEFVPLMKDLVESITDFKTRVTLFDAEERDLTEEEAANFDVIMYYGLDYRGPMREPTVEVINDWLKGRSNRKLVWLGYNLYSFPTHDWDVESSATIERREPGVVRYGGQSLVKLAIGHFDRVTVNVTGAKARVRAWLEDETGSYPIIVTARSERRDENFFFFGFHPTAFLMRRGVHLAFLDIMHEVYGATRAKKQAIVRLEDINALTNFTALLKIIDLLKNAGVPVNVSLIPIYAINDRRLASLSRDRAFQANVRQILIRRAKLVIHGDTHQLHGVTGEDFEFWDTATSQPLTRENAVLRIDEARREFKKASFDDNVVGWETPHYRAGPEIYEELEARFDFMFEDPWWSKVLLFAPYQLKHGATRYLGTFLGYVAQNREQETTGEMLEDIKTLSALSYGVTVAFFFHPYLDSKYLMGVVNSLVASGWDFPSLTELLN